MVVRSDLVHDGRCSTGQVDRWLAPLRDAEPDIDAWTKAWDSAAAQQEEHAEQDLRRGFRRSASARYLRASTYYLTGERQTPPAPAKTRSYEDARKAFDAAGSTDKELRIFTVAEGGSEHCNADDPDPARQLVADWFADRLGTVPATI